MVSSWYNENSMSDHFYPYREQQKKNGAVPIREYQEPKQHHARAHHHHRRLPNHGQFHRWVQIAIGGCIVIFLGFIGFVYAYNAYQRSQVIEMTPSAVPSATPTATRTPSPTMTPTPTLFQPQFPNPTFQAAYEQTINVQTAKVAFVSDVTTTVGQPNDARTYSLSSRVEGYLVGSAIDDTMQTEVRITYRSDESRNIAFRQILVGENLYLQQSTASDTWTQRERSDYNRLYENQPIDATAYAYNLLDTLFSDGKTFLRSIDPTSIEEEEPRTIEDRSYTPFRFTILIPRYLEILRQDQNTTEFILEDAEKILRNAAISGTIYVAESGYIERIEFTGSNLTQISDEDAVQLGITTTHSMSVLALFSEFNDPLSIVPPPEDQVE